MKENKGGVQEVRGGHRIKSIKMCYIDVPVPREECDHYVLQDVLIKNKG